MCGFVVVLGLAGRAPDRVMIDRMTASLAHRGPDDAGFWSSGSVAMGFRRLAIIDRSPAAHQPMLGPDRHEVLVFNGEIYNYVELRTELRTLGHHFQSKSDTEVVLAAWRQWGAACVDRFVGMFAFVIWDGRRRELFGARDRAGVKPLFIYRGSDVVILASEIKAIHASGLAGHQENWSSIAGYLLEGQLDETTATCFEGIEHIPAAHMFTLGLGGQLRKRRYFDWPTHTVERADDAPETIADLLEESVRVHLRSDLPTGVCLSGGVDSTAIVCAMVRQRRAAHDPHPLLAFNYNSAEYDESQYLSATLRATGATLVSSQVDPRQMWAAMPRVLHFHDEPLHSMNALVGFDLMRLARLHGAIVVLNGQGADELLAGYSDHYDAYWTTLVVNGRIRTAAREIGAFARAFGASSGRLGVQVAWRLGFRALGHAPGYDVIAAVARRALHRRNVWFTADVAKEVPDRASQQSVRLQAAQRGGVTASPLPMLLRVEDRNSMAHGVEVRVPFLDHQLASYSLTLPLDWRIRGKWNKYALREAMRGRIPEIVRRREDKMGFPVPTGKWFAGELYEPVRDVLNSAAARGRGLYHSNNLLRELDRHRGTDVAEHRVLFRAANVELWLSMLATRRAEMKRALSERGTPAIRVTVDHHGDGPSVGATDAVAR
jgi:asparagine synthase (glutamine-hydrolysing)